MDLDSDSDLSAMDLDLNLDSTIAGLVTSLIQTKDECDMYQFGFKQGHSIMFSNLLLTLLKHLTTLTIGNLVRLFAFWYSNQEAYVRWRNRMSACFTFVNGTRQGGVLSPYLFARYNGTHSGALKLTDLTLTDQNAWVENDGPDISGPKLKLKPRYLV